MYHSIPKQYFYLCSGSDFVLDPLESVKVRPELRLEEFEGRCCGCGKTGALESCIKCQRAVHLSCARIRFTEEAVVCPECRDAAVPRQEVEVEEAPTELPDGPGQPSGGRSHSGEPAVEEAFTRGSEAEYQDMVGAAKLAQATQEEEREFWERMSSIISDKTYRVWNALEKALHKYHALLGSRGAPTDEVGLLMCDSCNFCRG